MLKGWVLMFLTVLLFSGFAYAVDSDEDGLSDSVEFSLGSSPYHKDIFVEIDWLIVNGGNLKPKPGFVQFVQSIFAAAPVLNPGNGNNFNAGASDFLVTLGGAGWFNKPNAGQYKYTQVGTFVHELGHNLGLKHGGTDHTQYKPNLLSLMNYAFQTDGIPYTRADGVEFRIIDYCCLYLLY